MDKKSIDPTVRLLYYLFLRGERWHIGEDPEAANEYLRIVKYNYALKHAGKKYTEDTIQGVFKDLKSKYE